MISARAARPFGEEAVATLRADAVAMLRDDAGQGAVEYGFILCFVVVVAMIGMRYLAAKVNNTLSNSANQLPY